jgi:hypothetical protein
VVDINIDIEEGDSDSEKRPPSVLIGLPDELAEWADQNRDLIRKVLHALKDSYANLTEDQIWETIADVSSPEWKPAHDAWLSAEKEMSKLKHPMHAPLGAIGEALDSDETGHAQHRHDTSLAEFTIINEGLRNRPDLENLLKVLLVQKRMLDQSTSLTRQAQRAFRKLTHIVSLREDFAHAARRPGRVRQQFLHYARGLLAPKKKQKVIYTTGVVVPWQQGTN